MWSSQSRQYFFLEVQDLLWAVLEGNGKPEGGLLVVRQATNSYVAPCVLPTVSRIPCSVSAECVIRDSHALKSPKISSFEIWSEFTTIATKNTSGFLILDGNNTFERYEPWSAHTNQCLSPPLDWHRNWPCSLRSSCQVRQKMSRKLKPTSDHQEQMFRLNMNPCDAGCVEARCQGWAALRRFKPKADSGAALWPSPPFPLS